MPTRVAALLTQLPATGTEITVSRRAVRLSDLAHLTRLTNHEFALFRRGGDRLVVRGDQLSVTSVDVARAERLRQEGWIWSAHTHVGVTDAILDASGGDAAVLAAFQQQSSIIINSTGRRRRFFAGLGGQLDDMFGLGQG